ncbi:hypothetical protein ACLB2K_071114 [Fragaria x ananassa]
MCDKPSYAWRSIMEARPILKAGLQWRIGNGTRVGIWSSDWIPGFPAHSLSKPHDTIFELVSDLIDDASWTWNRHAVFLFYVGGNIASTSDGDPHLPIWRALWKAKVPNKVAIFGWRAAHNLLPTRAALTLKGYNGDLSCVVCNQSVESLEHLFCTCNLSREIFGNPPFSFPQSHIAWKDWLLERAATLTPAMFDRQRERQFRKPPIGTALKLNVDGAFLPTTNQGGFGGVVRDSQRQFIVAFAHRMEHVSSALHAELEAVRYGVGFLQSMGVSEAIVESDCLVAVDSIKSLDQDLYPLSAINLDVKSS